MASRIILLSNIKNVHTCLQLQSKTFHASSVLGAKPLKKAGATTGKSGQQMKKIVLDVETDPKNLVTKCCGANIYVDGTDPDLKPDSEYPDWLWTLRTDPKPIPLDELDPNTKDYWNKLRKIGLRKRNQSLKLQKF